MNILIMERQQSYYDELLYANQNLFGKAELTVRVSDVGKLRGEIVKSATAIYGDLDYLSFEVDDSGIVPGKEDLTWYKIKIVFVKDSVLRNVSCRLKHVLYDDDDDY